MAIKLPHQTASTSPCKFLALPMAPNPSGGTSRLSPWSPLISHIHNWLATNMHRPLYNLQPICRWHCTNNDTRVSGGGPARFTALFHLRSKMAERLAPPRQRVKDNCYVIPEKPHTQHHSTEHTTDTSQITPSPWPHYPGRPTMDWAHQQ